MTPTHIKLFATASAPFVIKYNDCKNITRHSIEQALDAGPVWNLPDRGSDLAVASCSP